MSTCEKCWGDAYLRAYGRSDTDQATEYHKLLDERRNNPCPPEQQRGERDDDECYCGDYRSEHPNGGACSLNGLGHGIPNYKCMQFRLVRGLDERLDVPNDRGK